jgi:hypothetical protein
MELGGARKRELNPAGKMLLLYIFKGHLQRARILDNSRPNFLLAGFAVTVVAVIKGGYWDKEHEPRADAPNGAKIC